MSRTKYLASGLFLPLIFSASVAVAEDSPHGVSANITATSDYVYRGITQTDGSPAFQGGLDYEYSGDAFPVGFYAGIWGSNTDFNDGGDATLEVDYYGGFVGEMAGTGIDWTVCFNYYDYPGSDSGNNYGFFEYGAGLGYTFKELEFSPELRMRVWISDNFFGDTGDAVYLYPTLGLSLPYDLGLELGYGYQDVDGIGEYEHVLVGLSKGWNDFTFDLTYSDTFDAGDDFCAGGSDLCDNALVFTVARSF